MADVAMRRSRGPRWCADLFKAVAVIAIAAGVIGGSLLGAELARNGQSVAHAVDYGFLTFVGGVLVGASIAFYGYVLDLLADIRDNGDRVAAREVERV